jgi:hypothetical protein
MSIVDSLRENALADNELLRKNDARGDVFDKPRDVDFAFKTNDKERAESLCEFVKGMNFGSPSVTLGDDGVYWIVNVIQMPITQHLLCSVSGFMVCLGRLFQVEYDGWGSIIQSRAVVASGMEFR